MLKKGFTIIEVSILFVIFLIVAFLAAPLSLDDTVQAKNTSRWRSVQEDFSNIFYAVNTYKEESDASFKEAFDSVIKNEFKDTIKPYKITFMNNSFTQNGYKFDNFKITYSNAIVAYQISDSLQEEKQGMLMYDVNGSKGPNIWGKDVFGYDITSDGFEPFCKNESVSTQKRDCSKRGMGLCCSNYYLVGGSFDK